MVSALVTGGNRGIGLGIVKELLKRREFDHVFATTRGVNDNELRAIVDSRLHIIPMDVLSDDDIEEAAETVAEILDGKGLNFLINNAGFLNKYDMGIVDREKILMHFNVNATAPLIILQYFHPLLRLAAANGQRAVAAIVSSTAGSLRINMKAMKDITAYKMSKAAVNMVTRDVSGRWKADGVVVASFCPGSVKTEMGGLDDAQLTVDESVTPLVATILDKVSMEHTGGYFTRHLEPLPW